MAGNDYKAGIAKGLDDALGRANPIRWDIGNTKAVIFSDLHRGYKDHADDFRKCEGNYHNALNFYFNSGYTLLILGDSEELWECRPRKVVATYEESLQKESQFFHDNERRYTKVWGNHDDFWRVPRKASTHLSRFFGEAPFPEALDITVTEDDQSLGRIYLVHGHQGTPGSDKWGKYTRHIVRWVWRPAQRLFKFSLTTPADDFEVRGKHDRAMYDWAANRNDLILIAGHTHRPVFVSKPHVETIERIYADVTGPALESVRPEQVEQRELADQEIAWAKAESGDGELESIDRARDRLCYFNTGCCSYSNGDATAIEIADGEIRLVRWSTDLGDPANRVLEKQKLRSLFAELTG